MMLIKIREHLQRQDGVAALEFAIVAMVFLIILYGILTYGFIFGLDQSLNHAAEEGARAAIAETTDAAAMSEAIDVARARLGWLGASRIADMTFNATIVTGAASCDADASIKCVRLEITYPWGTKPIIPPFPGMPAPSQMQAVAIIELT